MKMTLREKSDLFWALQPGDMKRFRTLWRHGRKAALVDLWRNVRRSLGLWVL